MGQYYNILMQEEGKKQFKVYDRTINGEYTPEKLMEHSWYLNDMVNAISEKLYYKPHKIAWVGDYADDFEHYEKAWEYKKAESLEHSHFTLNGRYLVNHTKKEYLDCWEYVCRVIRKNPNGSSWIIHPLPLLTAVGNGRGGGDFRGGIGEEFVGTWAWDTIEVVEYQAIEELQRHGDDYKELQIEFIEK